MIYLDAGATTLQKPPAVALAVQSAMRRMATTAGMVKKAAVGRSKSPPLAVKKVRLAPVQKQLPSCRFSPVFPMLRRPAWKAVLAGRCLSVFFLLQGQ